MSTINICLVLCVFVFGLMTILKVTDSNKERENCNTSVILNRIIALVSEDKYLGGTVIFNLNIWYKLTPLI